DHAVAAQPQEVAVLHAADFLVAVRAGDARVLRVPLVRPAPAVVLRDGDGRAERPVLAGRADLGRGGRADPADQARVVRRAEGDVLREDGGAEDVVVAVHGVDAPDRRDAQAGGLRRGPVGVGEVQPVLWGGVLVAAGPRAAAVEHGADGVLLDLVRRDLADL